MPDLAMQPQERRKQTGGFSSLPREVTEVIHLLLDRSAVEFEFNTFKSSSKIC